MVVARAKHFFVGRWVHALCANVLETPTPIEFSVEGGEVETNGSDA
jgi:hypothetical protein